MNQNVSIHEAAKLLGKSQQFVREGLKSGILPIGTAVKMSSKWTYHVSRRKLNEYIGEVGEKD